MRIAIDTTSFIGILPEGLGGYLANLIDKLQDEDRENEYIVFMPRYHQKVFQHHQKNFQFFTLPNWTNTPIGGILWCWLGLPFFLRRYKIDVVHFPDYRRIMLWKPCRVVTTVHDFVNWKVPGRINRIRRFYHVANRPWMKRQADLFITGSENAKKDMLEVGFPASLIHVIPHGVSPSFHPRTYAEVRETMEKFGIPEKFVLCVSRLEHPQKNHVTLLRAWDRLKKKGPLDHKLVLVGRKWWNWDVVIDEIDRLGLKDDVIYIDYVSSADLPIFYSAAQIFVFPSLYEGFGLPVIEAMASGTPLIAARSSSVKDIVEDAALLFPPTDDAELSRHLEKLLGDAVLREKMKEGGLRVAGQYSWGRSAFAHSQVYQGVKKLAG